MAAANPPEQAADGWDLSAPLANRLCHLTWDIDPRAVADGLAGGWAAPPVPELPGAGRPSRSWPWRWSPRSCTSGPRWPARRRPRPTSAGRGWPSPRTWEMAARLWAAAERAGRRRGPVRAGPRRGRRRRRGAEFLTWLAEMDLPDPEAVLADPASFTLPERADRAYAALAAVAAVVAADPTPERWAAGWQVLGIAAAAGPGRGRGGGPGAGPVPARRRPAARRDPAVRAGAARRRAAGAE